MTTALIEEKLSDEALLVELTKVIDNVNCAESHSQLSVIDIVDQLDPLVKDFEGLDSVLYREIESYHGAAQTAIGENRENSFNNQQGMLEKLTKIKAEYLGSLVEPYSLLYH